MINFMVYVEIFCVIFVKVDSTTIIYMAKNKHISSEIKLSAVSYVLFSKYQNRSAVSKENTRNFASQLFVHHE